jgi:O-antigen/teichoic acid export membrane protein
MAAAIGRYPAQAGGGAFGVARQLTVISVAVVALSAPLAAVVLVASTRSSAVEPIDLAAAIAYAFGFGVTTALRSLYFWSGQVSRYARAEITSWIVFAILVAASLVTSTFAFLVWTFVVQAAWFCGWAVLDHRDMFRVGGPRVGGRELTTFAGLNLVGSFPSMATPQLALLLVTSFDSTAAAGTYAAMVSLTTPIQLLPRALGLVLYPRLARARAEDPRRVAADAASLAREIVPLAVGPLLLVIASAPLWIGVVIGNAGGPAIGPLALLLGAQAISIIAVPAVAAQTTGPMREVAHPAAWSVLGLVASVVVWLVAPMQPISLRIAFGVLVGAIMRAGGPLVSVHGRPTRNRILLVPTSWAIIAGVAVVAAVFRLTPLPVIALGLGIGLATIEIHALSRTGRPAEFGDA